MQAKHTTRVPLRGGFSDVTRGNLTHTTRHVPMLFHQVWRYKVQHRAYAPPEVRIFLRIHCEQEPTSRSSITLTNHHAPLRLLRAPCNPPFPPRTPHTIPQPLPL